jgi:biotin carboxylase
MRKKIAIIGANMPLLHFFKKTKKLGYEIHCFAWDKDAVCKYYADFFYPISYTEKEKILDKCRKIRIDGITSFTLESALPTVNYVSNKLNLNGNSLECEKYTKNKYTMRQRLADQNIRVPEYQLIKTKKELFEKNWEYPLIVKPIDNGGSRGVTKVTNIKELVSAYQRAKLFSKLNKIIVEQYIEGREFSVEYISHKGNHYFLSITDKITTGEPYFVELEHHQPSLISEKQKKKIKNITENTLNALKVLSSASHTELKMDKKGDIYIIEIGLRMGGDRIGSDLVYLSTGYDFIKGVLKLAIGEFSVPKLKWNKSSGIYFLTKESDHVEPYINNSEKYAEIIIAEKNSNIKNKTKESSDRAGFFIYKAKRRFTID